VSEVLGHKEVAITLDRYSHALPTLHTRAMARLDALLGPGDDAPRRRRRHKGSRAPLTHPAALLRVHGCAKTDAESASDGALEEGDRRLGRIS